MAKLAKNWIIWWRLLRPITLTASVIPVCTGTAYALFSTAQPVSSSIFVAMLLASILIQSATNMFNEYYDYARGLDTEQSVGIGGTIVRDGVRPQTILKLAGLFYIVSVFLGLYIVLNSSWWVALTGLICMAAGYLYTGGPYPIAYTPFGEIVAALFMGVVMIVLSFYIQTGTVTMNSMLISIPVAMLVAAILKANNIRDREEDIRGGRKTIAILVGHTYAVRLLAVLFGSTYLSVVGMMIVSDIHGLWLLLTFLSIPVAIQAIRRFQHNASPATMMPAMKATAQVHALFGLLYSIAFVGMYLTSF